MDARNSGGESQSLDGSQPIQKTDGDGSKLVGGPVAVVAGGGVTVEVGNAGGEPQPVKRKRGRPPRVQAKPPVAKKSKEEEEEEDVCFICFDGGSLVLCDRRGCPKAYHPACIKRDEAFFRSKAKWNCGWHICSICEKTAHHMCYTCTYSLCKGCIKMADYVCVRGDKGFCTICMKTIMLIENSGQGKDETARVDFDDKTSWEYLFKVYWVYLKEKLSLTLDELTRAKNPFKIHDNIPLIDPPTGLIPSIGPSTASITSVGPSTGSHIRPNGLRSITSDLSFANLEANESKRRKTHEQANGLHNETIKPEKPAIEETPALAPIELKEWASKELLDFVSHMKNGDTSILSQFDVQALLLDYIKRNNLRDPRKKNQILCDLRLKNLFGKPKVGHIEMLKLLEFHFTGKQDSVKKPGEADWKSENIPVVVKERERRSHRKSEQRAPQNKLDEFASVDVHNMNLIYLRQNLVVNLIEDLEKFHEKVVGSIVQIRISGSDQEHDMYRLVQVVGTSKVDVPYKIGDKPVDIMLEVLNLDKKEAVSIDTISNQELSEDDCRRLRESIRCGLVRCFTVGEIQEKAMALRSVLLDDRMEAEMTRLNQLRDRASEKGQKKGVRDCVKKLQLLKRPEERERRLHEIPEVHSDPKMNPDYESDDTEEYFNNEHGEHQKPKYPWVSGTNTITPRKRSESSNDKPKNVTYPNAEEGSSNARSNTAKDEMESRPQTEVDCVSSTIVKQDRIPVAADPVADGGMWHYRDPNGNVQGPFPLVQLQKWKAGGFFPVDMKIWTSQEEDLILLNNVVQERPPDFGVGLNENENKIGNQSKCTDVPVGPYGINSVNLEKLPDEHDPNLNHEARDSPANQAFTIADAEIVDLPGPLLKKTSQEDEKIQDSKLLDQESSWSTTLSLVVGGAQLPEPPDEWAGYATGTSGPGPDRLPHSSIKPLAVLGDHTAVPIVPVTTIEQIMHSSPPPPPPSEPACSHLPPWHGIGETIEFSTLAEESVSDLLAEVDAMESRNGVPSPTSRRNSFLEDLFNGSIDEFSPTTDQGTRSDGFSSSLPVEHMAAVSQSNNGNVFDLVKRPTGLQFSFGPTSSDNMGFKWSTGRQDMIDLNDSTKAEVDEGEREMRIGDDRVKEKAKSHAGFVGRAGGGSDVGQQLATGGGRKSNTEEGGRRKFVGGVVDEEEEEGEFIQPEVPPPPPPPLPPPPPPPPPPPLTMGLDVVDSRKNTGRPSQGTSNTGRSTSSRSGNSGRERDSHHRRSGGDRYSSNSPRERTHHVEDSGHGRSSRASWGRQTSFGSGGGGGSGGGYSRPQSKGQRVCKFYESGRCKKGSACNYLHP